MCEQCVCTLLLCGRVDWIIDNRFIKKKNPLKLKFINKFFNSTIAKEFMILI